MSTNDAFECIDQPIADLVEMFRSDLAKLSFPGVDAGTLNAAVAKVKTQAAIVDRLRLEHQQALHALSAEQRALRDHATQAHAYARVFASGNGELNTKLDQIVLSEPASTAPKKRRARRAKKAATAPQLVLESAPAQASSGAA